MGDGQENVEGVLQYRSLLYVPEIICSKVISCHHNDLLVGHFRIDETQELVARKYYWPTFCHNVETHIRGCVICLASKAVCHKSYGDLQLLSVPIHCWKDFLMDFFTGLASLTNWKGESYDSILVIVDQLTKMVYYKPVKVIINAQDQLKSSQIWQFGTMASSIQLCWIKAHCSPRNFGHRSTTSLASNGDSQLPSILRQMAGPNVKMV